MASREGVLTATRDGTEAGDVGGDAVDGDAEGGDVAAAEGEGVVIADTGAGGVFGFGGDHG